MSAPDIDDGAFAFEALSDVLKASLVHPVDHARAQKRLGAAVVQAGPADNVSAPAGLGFG